MFASIPRRMTQFRDRTRKEGTVDVYWLYDDGGLTLLLPHILSTRAKFARYISCKETIVEGSCISRGTTLNCKEKCT